MRDGFDGATTTGPTVVVVEEPAVTGTTTRAAGSVAGATHSCTGTPFGSCVNSLEPDAGYVTGSVQSAPFSPSNANRPTTTGTVEVHRRTAVLSPGTASALLTISEGEGI
ncbi:MAG TPA: hypothetical protein VGH94_03460, partial [Acidimicrobiales bacterium]